MVSKFSALVTYQKKKIQCTSNFYTNHENSGGGGNHDGRIDVNNGMVEQALR